MKRLANLECAIALGITAFVAAAGCVDPAGKLTEFEERVGNNAGDGDGGDGDGGDGDGDGDKDLPEGAAADISGRFVVGLELSNLAPGAPIRLLAENVYTGDETGGELSLTFFPLDSAGNLVASDMNPGTDAQIPTMSDVDADGLFRTVIIDGEVPQAANPITFTPITLTINDLDSVILSADGFCGVFDDAVSSTGTPLTGTTAALRVGDDDIGNQLPAVDQLFNCEQLQEQLDSAAN